MRWTPGIPERTSYFLNSGSRLSDQETEFISPAVRRLKVRDGSMLKSPNCLATNFPPKDESRDDCSSICPQASYQSHRRVHRFAMPPPTHFIRSPRPRFGEFVFSDAKRLFRQHRSLTALDMRNNEVRSSPTTDIIAGDGQVCPRCGRIMNSLLTAFPSRSPLPVLG